MDGKEKKMPYKAVWHTDSVTSSIYAFILLSLGFAVF